MAISEVRTQIYLSRKMFGDLRKKARAEKRSLAEVVRQAIGTYLEEETRRSVDWENDPISQSLGSIVADHDLSSDHDHYVYGWSKKKK